MERPQANIEQPEDEFDFELTQTQANVIALADELLKKKPEGSRWTFVDIVLRDDAHEMFEEFQQGPLAHLLAAPDENLAMESDGSYYPILDLRKENAVLTGMSLRVWGWDTEKSRYTDPDQKQPPYDIKEYPGEIDKSRQIELSMGWRAGKDHADYATESVSVTANSSQHNYIYAHSEISMPVYAETGYEGHGGKSDDDTSDEAVEWFLEFVARHVGDQPMSTHDVMALRVAAVRALAEKNGALKAVDRLIKGTWEAQAMYIMSKPCTMLDGQSIIQSLKTPDNAPRIDKAARAIVKAWKAGTWGELFIKNQDEDEDDDE